MREHYLISEKCQAIARAAHRERISRPHSSDRMERRVLLGGYSSEVPPLPIPNREVKLTNADGTAYLGGRVGSRLFKPSPNKGSVFLCMYVNGGKCGRWADFARLESAAAADCYVTHPPKSSLTGGRTLI